MRFPPWSLASEFVREKAMRPFRRDFHAALPCLGGQELFLFRLAGGGLGNMLFPWARAHVWAKEQEAAVLCPTWPQLKLGPALRRERDLRTYAFQFHPAPDEVTGIERTLALAVCEQVSEQGVFMRRGLPQAGLLRRFSGLRDYFISLRGHGLFLRARLEQAIEQRLLSRGMPAASIAVHVRCGDFRVPPEEWAERLPEGGLPPQFRLPLRAVVEALRDVLSVAPGPVRVYSDGTDRELGPLLEMPGVERSRGRSAVAEMLEMADARILIGTPHSTFSLWSAFLGRPLFVGFPEGGGKNYGFGPSITTLDSARRKEEMGRRLNDHLESVSYPETGL